MNLPKFIHSLNQVWLNWFDPSLVLVFLSERFKYLLFQRGTRGGGRTVVRVEDIGFGKEVLLL